MELKELIRTNFPYLRDHTTNLKDIFAHLYSREIITSEEYQELKNEYINPTTGTTCDRLYTLLIRKEICQNLLWEILSLTGNQHVINQLFVNGIIPKGAQMFWEVPQRNELFTGRKNVLENLQTRLINTSVDLSKSISKYVLYGMGGIGKSSTVLEFIYENKDKFSHIFWFRAEFEDNLKLQFTQLGKQLINSENFKLLLESWFEKPANQNWLMVLDNVEEENEIKKFLPRFGGHVLITSRNQFWPPLISGLMPKFKDSVQMLERILGKEDAEFDHLSKELGNLPLAIFNASKFLISNQDLTVQYYLELFERNCEYFMKFGNDLDEREKAIYSSVKITLDKIQSEDALAYSWLQMIAYCNPDDINTIMIKYFLKINGQESDLKFLKVKSLVLKYGIVKFGKKGFSIHRLVQKTIELCNNENGRPEQALKSAFEFSQNADLGFHHTWFIFPHLIKTTFEISKKCINNFERNEKLNKLHGMVYQISDIRPRTNLLKIFPISKYEEYYEIIKPCSLEPHIKNYVGLLRLMGGVYCDKLDYEKSSKFYLEALHIKEKKYGENHDKLKHTLQDLAYVYEYMPNLHESIVYCQRIVSIIEAKIEKCQENDFQTSDSFYYGPSYMNYKSSHGEYKTELWLCFRNIGKLYQLLQDWENSKKMYERILAEKVEEFGETDVRLKINIEDLVEMYSKMGEGDSVESQLLKLRLDIFNKLFDIRVTENRKFRRLHFNKITHFCDICKFKFQENSTMFKCNICDDFDLCQNCFDNDKDHRYKHSFNKF